MSLERPSTLSFRITRDVDGKHVVLEHGPRQAILEVRTGRIRPLDAGLFPVFSGAALKAVGRASKHGQSTPA